MDGSPSSVLTIGLGSWGSVNLLTTLGLGIGAAVTITPAIVFTLPERSMNFTVPERNLNFTLPTRGP